MFLFAVSNPFSSEFWHLSNTNLVVAIAFLVFVGFLLYKGVPKLIAGLLDKRAEGIKSELEEARRLRDEAQNLYAEHERKIAEVELEAEEIVKTAKKAAEEQAKIAEQKLADQIERRIASGKEQIAAAEAAVERNIRSKATAIAIEAAREVLSTQASAKSATDLIDQAIADLGKNLN